MDLAGEAKGQCHHSNPNLSWDCVKKRLDVLKFLFSILWSHISDLSVCFLQPCSGAGPECRRYRKVELWSKQQEIFKCAQEGKTTDINHICFLNILLKKYLHNNVYTITGTETHHLLSAELCEYSDQPVSTQRGCTAAATDASTYTGKNNIEVPSPLDTYEGVMLS